MIRKGKTSGAKLTPEQIARLDGIGMVWKTKPERQWEKGYAKAKAYYEEYGNLNIPSKYRPDGIWLAKWLNEQKQIHAGKRKGKTLRADQAERLEAIGICWERHKNSRNPDEQSSEGQGGLNSPDYKEYKEAV